VEGGVKDRGGSPVCRIVLRECSRGGRGKRVVFLVLGDTVRIQPKKNGGGKVRCSWVGRRLDKKKWGGHSEKTGVSSLGEIARGGESNLRRQGCGKMFAPGEGSAKHIGPSRWLWKKKKKQIKGV